MIPGVIAISIPDNQAMEKTEQISESKSRPFRIRLATNQDTEQIKQLVFSVMEEFGLEPDPDGLDADLTHIEENYLQLGGLFEVVETSDGTIVGTAGLMIRQNGVAELRKMYLRKDFRGKGIGRALLEDMLAHARRIGVEVVELETNSVLRDAIRLYTGYGFRPLARRPHSRRSDQVYQLRLK
jgi:putative acetyltransferase